MLFYVYVFLGYVTFNRDLIVFQRKMEWNNCLYTSFGIQI